MPPRRQRAHDRVSRLTPRSHSTWLHHEGFGDGVGAWSPKHFWYPYPQHPDGSWEVDDSELGLYYQKMGQVWHGMWNGRQGADRTRHFWVYKVYTRIRLWARKVLERMRVAAAKEARLPYILRDRGGR